MQCLFCKQSTTLAKSVEHIVPESLGNRRHILPRGAICDSCNNYFACEVEGPLLAHRSFRNLRAWHQVPTKKGRLPSLQGVHLGSDIEINLRKSPRDGFRIGPYVIEAERQNDQVRLLRHFAEDDKRFGPAFAFKLGEDAPLKPLSRFIAKMALEYLYLRLSPDAGVIHRVVSDAHYDRIRNWARRGDNVSQWPISQRIIYPEDTLMRHPQSKKWVRVGFGMDLFLTRRRETYFAFCLYGREMVINLGGPSIKGYEEWLEENNNISPLVERVGSQLVERSTSGRAEVYLVDINDTVP